MHVFRAFFVQIHVVLVIFLHYAAVIIHLEKRRDIGWKENLHCIKAAVGQILCNRKNQKHLYPPLKVIKI